MDMRGIAAPAYYQIIPFAGGESKRIILGELQVGQRQTLYFVRLSWDIGQT
jgi:hypothetical protein